jgi:hypothetical protein
MGNARRPVSLALLTAPVAPHARGRLLFVEDVVRDIFRGRKTAWWVRHNVAPNEKFHIGRDCAWYEADVHAWLDSLRSRSA